MYTTLFTVKMDAEDVSAEEPKEVLKQFQFFNFTCNKHVFFLRYDFYLNHNEHSLGNFLQNYLPKQ
jgi:hypothetical protein